jgi:hypothetical protein
MYNALQPKTCSIDELKEGACGAVTHDEHIAGYAVSLTFVC